VQIGGQRVEGGAGANSSPGNSTYLRTIGRIDRLDHTYLRLEVGGRRVGGVIQGGGVSASDAGLATPARRGGISTKAVSLSVGPRWLHVSVARGH